MPDDRQPSPSRAWGVAIIVSVFLLIAFGAVWFVRASSNATFSVSARAGALTLEPLCGERLVWDLPPGRIVPRSSMPGDGARFDGDTTLVLLPGARARIESTAAGMLGISVGRADEIQRACSATPGPVYEVTTNGSPVADDALGVNYAAAPSASGGEPTPLALMLSGRIVLGEVVQVGAGWGARAHGILESGQMDLQVVPWLDSGRVTLRTEALDEGSLLDTHACLASTNRTGASDPCPEPMAPPARGFLRTLPDGKLAVQLYTRGPVGTQAFGGEPHVLRVSRISAALRSPTLQSIAALIGLVYGFFKGWDAFHKGWQVTGRDVMALRRFFQRK